MEIQPNILFKCDCMELLNRLDTEAVDLVYLDPPLVESVGSVGSFPTSNADYSTDQQLRMISRTCQEVHRVLRNTGALFFHTSPSYAFSVRLILSQVFGEQHFRGELVWQPPAPASRMRREHDSILFYSKSDEYANNRVSRPLTPDETRNHYSDSDERGPFALVDLTAPVDRSHLQFEWHGSRPPKSRSWRFNAETLAELERDGRIYLSERGGQPRLKKYLSESEGVDVGTIWTDIPMVSRKSPENTGYALQKPLGLLDRLVLKGSNAGDVVLDPFCGSGTAVIASERHQRKWIACDLATEAVELTAKRVVQELGDTQPTSFSIADSDTLRRFPKKLLHHAKPVAVTLRDFDRIGHREFVLNHPVSIEETRHFEFKEIRGGNPVDTIVNTSDEYAVAFLNSEGGRIYWGVRDKDRIVIGVRLSYQERDRIRRDVSSKLNQIEPRVDPSQYRIEIHEVHDEHGTNVPDTCVVELVVPASHSPEPFFTGGGEAWVKVDGNKQKLKGIALTDFIKRRLQDASALIKRE